MGDEPLVNPAAFDLILPDTLPEDPCYVAVLTNIMEHPRRRHRLLQPEGRHQCGAGDPAHLPQPHPYPKGTLDFEYEKVTGIQQAASRRWRSTTPPPNPSWKKPKRTI